MEPQLGMNAITPPSRGRNNTELRARVTEDLNVIADMVAGFAYPFLLLLIFFRLYHYSNVLHPLTIFQETVITLLYSLVWWF